MGSISRGIGRGVGCVLVLGLLLPAAARAQMSFGVAGGLSLATQGGDNAGDLGSRTGFNGGAFLDFPLGGIIFVQPGLYYVQKGYSDGADDSKLKLDYLEVPVLLRVEAIQSGTANLSFLLGPTFAFEVKCGFELEGVVEGDCADLPGTDFDSRSFDLGAAFGVGVGFPLSPTMSVIGMALYDLGLRSIDDSGLERDIKNEAVLLDLGLSWRMGG